MRLHKDVLEDISQEIAQGTHVVSAFVLEYLLVPYFTLIRIMQSNVTKRVSPKGSKTTQTKRHVRNTQKTRLTRTSRLISMHVYLVTSLGPYSNALSFRKSTIPERPCHRLQISFLKVAMFLSSHGVLLTTCSIEDGDDSDEDDDLEIGGVTQDYKCPLTLMPLKNPVTSYEVFSSCLSTLNSRNTCSEICGHSFSHDAIKEMFRNDRGAKKCPAAGCNKAFTITNCKPNKALEKKIKLFERRQKRKEEEQDAEEVIE